MKKNQLRTKRIGILFSLTTLLLFPFIGKAQLKVVSTSGNVGIGTTSPSNGKLQVVGSATVPSVYYQLAGAANQIISQSGSNTAYGWKWMQDEASTGDMFLKSRINNTDTDVMYFKRSNGNIGIGTPTPGGTLSILSTNTTGTTNSSALNLTANSLTSGTGLYIVSSSLTSGYLVDLQVSGTASSGQRAFNSNLSGASTTDTYTGVFTNSRTGTGSANTALYANATGGTTNYNLYLGALGVGTNNYSIYNPALAKSYFAGMVGIGTTGPNALLDVQGTAGFNLNGPFTGTGANSYASDQLFKTNVDSLENALTIIRQLKPKSYYFDTTNVYGLHFGTEKQYGFIAQELEQVLPNLVTSTTKHADFDTLGNVIHPAVTYKAVYYMELIAILTKGIQEQQQKIDSLAMEILAEKIETNQQDSINTSLQNQVNQLLTTITKCCVFNGSRSTQSPTNDQSQSSIKQTDVKLTDAQTIVLEQNIPNPFAEQTSINYSLPENTVKAQMLFYNAQGKLIQSTELTQKGKGTLNVFASDLSSGIYTYTLVVDGKIIETKKMVKQ